MLESGDRYILIGLFGDNLFELLDVGLGLVVCLLIEVRGGELAQVGFPEGVGVFEHVGLDGRGEG